MIYLKYDNKKLILHIEKTDTIMTSLLKRKKLLSFNAPLLLQ
jgi:hypothetical protein